MAFGAADMQLFNLEASLNGSETVGSVFSLPPIPQNDRFHCQTCTALDALVSSDNYGSMFLGSITALISRASHCETCRSIVHLCPVRAVNNNHLHVTIHYNERQPRLSIIFDDITIHDSRPRSESDAPPGVLQVDMSKRSIQLWQKTTTPNERSGRLFRPEAVDLNLLRRWINYCDSTHRAPCNSRSPLVSNAALPAHPRLSFIDLERECVATPQIPVTYVALSYVWGRIPTCMATRDNLEQLRRAGSLSIGSEFQVAKTIREAMKLARSLDERYLWVDSLCIVQDNENIRPHLDAMGSIYHDASYTIVVANGNNASVGIAGVGDNMGLRNESHVLRFPVSTFTLYVNRRVDKLNVSDWAWRAWTHQELMFSRRLLIVNGPHGLVSWVCQRATWSEEVQEPSEGYHIWHSELQIPTENETPDPGQANRFPLWADLISYGQTVTSYTTKALTYEGDVLAAFRGMTSIIECSFRCKFIYGLPEAFFDLALLWDSFDGIRRRRGSEQDDNFPSWSWMGWVGRISYRMMENSAREWIYSGLPILTSPVVTWSLASDPSQLEGFRQNQGATDQRRQLQSASVWTSLRISRNSDRVQPGSGWTRLPDRPGCSYVTHPSAPGAKFRYPVPSMFDYDIRETSNVTAIPGLYLLTAAEQAEFRVMNIRPLHRRYVPLPNQQPFSTRKADLVDENGNLAGIISIEVSDSEQPPREQPCVLIAISRSFVQENMDSEVGRLDNRPLPELRDERRPRTGNHYHFYNVLWIEWKDGIAYRKALGRVFQEAWDGQRKTRVDVVLG